MKELILKRSYKAIVLHVFLCVILVLLENLIFTAFGGLSGIAQTSAMIKDTDLSMKKYIFWKMVLCIITGILSVLLMQLVPINSACQM